MSFCFPSWSTSFSPAFHEDAKAMLEAALNKGNKPPVIQGRIEVVELSMGTQPPTLTLLEIGDLSMDRFRGILRLGYQGDAWLEVRCRVQANPLSHNPNLLPSSTLPLSAPLLASQPLLVPMTLRLSKLHLRAILILVVSKAKGITLVFKNDPLQNVDVSSTFDSVEVIRGYLQQEIEGQLREMFREDLPGIIHRLSQRWFTGTGIGGKVELPYKDNPDYAPSNIGTTVDDDDDPDDVFSQKPIFPPPVTSISPNVSPAITPRRRAAQRTARERRLSTAASESPTSYTVFPEIEEYDPTYGLRPEGVPTHSGYEAFGRLWEKARQGKGKGLGGLMTPSIASQAISEDRGDVSDGDWEEDEVRSFDMVEMNDALQTTHRQPMSRQTSGWRSMVGSRYTDEEQVEWETFPAVGGGVITRPRVYHSQSLIRAPSEAGGTGALPSPAGTATGGSITARASSGGGASSTIGSLRQRPMSTAPLHHQYMSSNGGPGPSSLRRLATTRSEMYLSHHPSRSEAYVVASPASMRNPHLPFIPYPTRRHSGTAASSSAARTSGSSWDTDKATRSGTMSTKATSQLPCSRPVSIDSKQRSPPTRNRAPSVIGTSPGRSFPPRHLGPGGITLPLNNSVSQLATLSHSAHTLSPYARGHEHIAVRSFPHLGKSGVSAGSSSSASLSAIAEVGGHGQNQFKARRKRIFHLGKKDGDEIPLSPDVDDSSPTKMANMTSPPITHDVFDDDSPERSTSRSRSPESDILIHTRRPISLTGVAQRVMAGQMVSPRPNYGRSPASRSSYGFPTVARTAS